MVYVSRSGFCISMEYHLVWVFWFSQHTPMVSLVLAHIMITQFYPVGVSCTSFSHHARFPSLRCPHCSSVHFIVHFIVHCGPPPEPAWRQFAPWPPFPIPFPIPFPSSNIPTGGIQPVFPSFTALALDNTCNHLCSFTRSHHAMSSRSPPAVPECHHPYFT